MRKLSKVVGCLLVLGLLLGGGLVLSASAQGGFPLSILFPFITTEDGKFTFITIVNCDGAFGPFGFCPPFGTDRTAAHSKFSIEFFYGTKPVSASSVGGDHPVVNTDPCEHFDSLTPTTANDMMIFEVGGRPSGALFGDTDSDPDQLPLKNRVGFLIVEPNPNTPEDSPALYGWATIVDAASGLVWTYSTDFFNSSTFDFGDFTFIDGFGDEGKIISWFPTSVVTTSWYILPLGTTGQMTPSTGGGLRIGLTADTGAFDLNEHFTSGTKNVKVRCLGIITRDDFLQPAVVLSTNGGGWTDLFSHFVSDSNGGSCGEDGTGFCENNFIALKIQSSTALGGTPKTTINQEPSRLPSFFQDP